MKGAQIGFSAGVIYPAIGYIISNSPGNSYLSVGHDDLIEEAMSKVDKVIDNSGIRHLIRSDVQRARKSKTGDTNKKKEFAGGYLIIGSANNHKVLRQRDLQFGFIDDYESIKQGSKESGSTKKLIEQRFAAYADKSKIFYISTPELKSTSNIYPVFMEGDQRKWKVPCPCCGVPIELKWSYTKENGDPAGIYWKTDNNDALDVSSVGYICQECGGFFDDRNKYEMNMNGFWEPTAKPLREGNYSYHISALNAPAGMYQWAHYVSDYLDATKDGKTDERKYKTFVNLCLGEPYEASAENIKASKLEETNIRSYSLGVVPEGLSKSDGNGEIVLLTCAADMNGVVDDARLDFEIRAWTETGSSYSIYHGSIGTFIPRENTIKNKVDRDRWTYEHNKHNSVWPEFEKVLDNIYLSDQGRKFKIGCSGLDTGHYTNYAYTFLDKTNCQNVYGLKGDKESVVRKINVDAPYFKPGRERPNLYLVDVSLVKDVVANQIRLKWDKFSDPNQPPGFVNFPLPAEGKYLYRNYFMHFESEKRVVTEDKDGNVQYVWKKVNAVAQNHFWD
jgi:phage terminase large subunit GpA-like protein